MEMVVFIDVEIGHPWGTGIKKFSMKYSNRRTEGKKTVGITFVETGEIWFVEIQYRYVFVDYRILRWKTNYLRAVINCTYIFKCGCF